MALTEIPVELSSTPGIADSSNATAITIDSSEQVGIGGSPSSNLHVKGTGETQIYIEAAASNNPGIRLLENGTNKWTIGNDQSNDSLFFYNFATTSSNLVVDTAGHVTMPNQPAFSAHTSAALTDIATSSADSTVKFGTKIYDQNGDFDDTTFTFTAPVTGKYQLNASVFVQNSDASCTFIRVKIATSNRNYVNIIDPEYSDDRERDMLVIAALADMDANDTALVQIAQYEGTAQMDVPASNNSRFTGFLAC